MRLVYGLYNQKKLKHKSYTCLWQRQLIVSTSFNCNSMSIYYSTYLLLSKLN